MTDERQRAEIEQRALEFIVEHGWEDDNYGVAREMAAFHLSELNRMRQSGPVDMSPCPDCAAAVQLLNVTATVECTKCQEKWVRPVFPVAAPVKELREAAKDLLEWMPKCGKGSSGYLRSERLKRALGADTKEGKS